MLYNIDVKEGLISVHSDRATEKQQRLLLSQIFHGKQAMAISKNDLLQAKRESRALRRAKNARIQEGQLLDAVCAKAIARTGEELIQALLASAIRALLEDEEPMSGAKVIQQSNVPFHSAKGSRNWVPGDTEAA